MTTATLTAEAAAGDLLDELRDLLNRHDGASSLDDVRALADDVTSALRRARGRITRLGRKATPEKTETPAEPQPAEKPEPPSRFDPEILGTKATPATIEAQPDHTPAPPTPAPAALDPASVTPTRVGAPAPSRAGRVVGVVAALWSILTRGIRWAVARFASDRGEPECIVCGPGSGCCSPVRGIHEQAPPVSATRRSPLDVAAGLQSQKRRMYAAYANTVLQWELGTRAFQGLETVEQAEAIAS